MTLNSSMWKTPLTKSWRLLKVCCNSEWMKLITRLTTTLVWNNWRGAHQHFYLHTRRSNAATLVFTKIPCWLNNYPWPPCSIIWAEKDHSTFWLIKTNHSSPWNNCKINFLWNHPLSRSSRQIKTPCRNSIWWVSLRLIFLRQASYHRWLITLDKRIQYLPARS